MADDLVLNLAPVGDSPAARSKVTYVGGNWRDRRRAKKRDDATGRGSNPDARKHASSFNATGANSDALGSTDYDRPTKRQRTEGASRPGGGDKHFQVASRLFTANPTAKTVFEDTPAEPAEPAQPSNAPLSEEASNFHALGLSRRVSQHLSAKLEMKAPTSIQKNTIPQLIKGDEDAFLQAQTGSGKTLAYLLPIIQRILALSRNDDETNAGANLNRNSGLFAIILAPTRELCKQISVVLEKLLRCCPWIVSTSVMGGESKHSEKARIRKGCNILIATPGRLTDHLENTKILDVGTVRWLVLDEGDRMMEMGFEQDLKKIVATIRKDPLKQTNKDGIELERALPKRRVTVLCSATMKMNVQRLGEISLHDAIHITAGKETTEEVQDDIVFAAPAQLKQTYVVVPAKLRLVTLIAFLKDAFARKGSVMKAIVFISCADSVDYHFDLLKSTTPPAKNVTALPATLKKDKKVSDNEDEDEDNTSISSTDDSEKDKSKDQKREKTDNTAPPPPSTVYPATYFTSPANPTILLHKLHGSLTQPIRTATLRSFSTCKEPAVLITTDISSRGLDVPAVELVIEYDPAFAIADHVHRIGRTARAGRPGKAALFLQPGCEEGYISMLPTTPPAKAQSFETILQKGFATAIEMPLPPPTAGAENDDEASQQQQSRPPTKQSPNARAEALQLSIEQRLLACEAGLNAAAAAASKKNNNKKGGFGSNNRKPVPAPRLAGASHGPNILDAARQGFRSHIRAYATHTKEEREVFDITALHLGHVAKSFGLREAPGGIGGGVQRRTHKVSGAGSKRKTGDRRDDGGAGGVFGGGNDDMGADVDAEAARRKMNEMIRKMGRNAASEFNIA
ncbi:P-loop containing nucleoside triphosphate hydrolase protein [Coniella lustricola]|uniref:ATP-dependent RNA helicase n=1 Tax=Coniella lustricola TaxID=2025994 RepID=A0A2T3ANV2_9PEZI|nr:P-loop containing nucleoside triphosphate hydrolase protein [Coniella lustricola]